MLYIFYVQIELVWPGVAEPMSNCFCCICYLDLRYDPVSDMVMCQTVNFQHKSLKNSWFKHLVNKSNIKFCTGKILLQQSILGGLQLCA